MTTEEMRYLSVDDLLILMHLSVDNLSVTEVGARLNLTQPAVTQRLRKVEFALGHKLIERAGRYIKLTPQGLQHSARAVAALNALRGEKLAS